MRLRSRYQLWTGERREPVTATARSLTVIGASPGGQFKPSCVPLKETDPPPRCLDPPDLCPVARGHLAKALPEIAIHPRDNPVPRLDEVDQRGLHSSAPGPREGQGDGVLCLEDEPEQFHRLVHQLEELRVQMADHRGRHSAEDSRVDIARPRSQQGADRQIQISVPVFHSCLPPLNYSKRTKCCCYIVIASDQRERGNPTRRVVA